ncbi:cytochrome P450 [Pendulispora albinea]|uniref:Cytochrome P450 n=1 Tax=Pendulispora albinea TaxID=2741071 RepID=A0ABZ2LM42_9BACT
MTNELRPLRPPPAVPRFPATSGVPKNLFFNPRDRAFNQNPYPHYERLRNEDPVHRSPFGVWFLGKYKHVREVLRNPSFSVQDVPGQLKRKNELLKTRKLVPNQPENLDALIANSENWFAFLEAPDHTRLRRLVTGAFHKHTVERLRGYVQSCAAAFLDPLMREGRMDLMQDFAVRLPQNVIAHLLGIPARDFPQCVAWAEVIGRIFDPLVSMEEYEALNRCSAAFMEYARGLIALRREDPQDDLISALIAARDDQDKLTEAELVSIILLNFGAGEETVVNLIGNGSLALIRHPDERAYLRSRPEIMPSAVEELLRYDAPLQMTSRTALKDYLIGDKHIKAGEQVYVALGSANRDPERFVNPTSLLLERENNQHMSFADGRHLCVGAGLARLEAQEAFKILLERMPDLRLVDPEADIAWRSHTVLRGMLSLPVRFTPSPIYSIGAGGSNA